jgi:hypothetical protein
MTDLPVRGPCRPADSIALSKVHYRVYTSIPPMHTTTPYPPTSVLFFLVVSFRLAFPLVTRVRASSLAFVLHALPSPSSSTPSF